MVTYMLFIYEHFNILNELSITDTDKYLLGTELPW